MTSTLDREHALELVNEARANGARLSAACQELNISMNTYRRWGRSREDLRPWTPRATPAHALSEEEKARILAVCHQPEFASLPPAQIVVRLLDEQQLYLASESTFYRVLREAGENHRRGRVAPPRPLGPPSRHRASAPNACWSWDVSYLPTRVRGQFVYLYLIVDIYSRMIVGAEVFEAENAANSEVVIRRALMRQGCNLRPPILHADNGSAMKGSTLRATLEKLGVLTSWSRPRVSNDNAYSEALFRTCKYRPEYPPMGFEDLEHARAWVAHFVTWYNEEHRHSAIRFVTPAQRHRGKDGALLQQRHAIYQQARAAMPRRWTGKTRNWTPVGEVWLNPENTPVTDEILTLVA